MRYGIISRDGYLLGSDSEGPVFQKKPVMYASPNAFLLATKPTVVREAIRKFVSLNFDLIVQASLADDLGIFVDALRKYLAGLEYAYERDDIDRIQEFLPGGLAILEAE